LGGHAHPLVPRSIWTACAPRFSNAVSGTHVRLERLPDIVRWNNQNAAPRFSISGGFSTAASPLGWCNRPRILACCRDFVTKPAQAAGAFRWRRWSGYRQEKDLPVFCVGFPGTMT